MSNTREKMSGKEGEKEMTDKKICPILTVADHRPAFCVENKCAWWNSELERCAIRELSLLEWLQK